MLSLIGDRILFELDATKLFLNCLIICDGFIFKLMFPEIEFDKILKLQGMDISIVTTSKTDEEAYFLLKLLGMPFKY